MKYNEFVNLVRQRGRLTSDREAELAIEATLRVLAQRLYYGEAAHLAAQLPPEVEPYLSDQQQKKLFKLSEFYENISRHAKLSIPEVRQQARAVMSVVVQTVSPGELEEVLTQLPEEFVELFTLGVDSNYV